MLHDFEISNVFFRLVSSPPGKSPRDFETAAKTQPSGPCSHAFAQGNNVSFIELLQTSEYLEMKTAHFTPALVPQSKRIRASISEQFVQLGQTAEPCQITIRRRDVLALIDNCRI